MNVNLESMFHLEQYQFLSYHLSTLKLYHGTPIPEL